MTTNRKVMSYKPRVKTRGSWQIKKGTKINYRGLIYTAVYVSKRKIMLDDGQILDPKHDQFKIIREDAATC